MVAAGLMAEVSGQRGCRPPPTDMDGGEKLDSVEEGLWPRTAHGGQDRLAAHELATCLWNGIGVVARFKEIPHDLVPERHYELDGWLAHASELVNKWHAYAATAK